ncbi:Hypothetical predicted protein [Olea europaea subsp. europaea]|uniref:Fe-S metabolism associated domain-containing protein n=1 Tax=Olea europaea subsp. europaea TaxID=158383 RepID=A0A8S0R7A3_OLEEU|nr:Hypothetical predicted protein [Olea europaea subsp. europaea]
MHCITLKPFSPSPPSFFRKHYAQNPQIFTPWIKCISHRSAKSRSRIPKPNNLSISFLTANKPPDLHTLNIAEKAYVLNSEFKSLSEPVERVKRLLHYATLLPPFDESLRIQENQITGCTAQVWVEVKMDNSGVMRFRIDSDSEITKGFSSCLIWLLDGAVPEEVLSVKTEDLVEMNVGLSNRAPSRVNPWHNVLISMQRRTKDLLTPEVSS